MRNQTMLEYLIEKRNALLKPYKLEIDNPYGEGRIVAARGEYDAMKEIKLLTKPELKPVIVKNV